MEAQMFDEVELLQNHDFAIFTRSTPNMEIKIKVDTDKDQQFIREFLTLLLKYKENPVIVND